MAHHLFGARPTDRQWGSVLDSIVDALPSRVTVFGRSIPIGVFAEGLNLVYQEWDLVDALFGEVTGSDLDTLKIVPL